MNCTEQRNGANRASTSEKKRDETTGEPEIERERQSMCVGRDQTVSELSNRLMDCLIDCWPDHHHYSCPPHPRWIICLLKIETKHHRSPEHSQPKQTTDRQMELLFKEDILLTGGQWISKNEQWRENGRWSSNSWKPKQNWGNRRPTTDPRNHRPTTIADQASLGRGRPQAR